MTNSTTVRRRYSNAPRDPAEVAQALTRAAEVLKKSSREFKIQRTFALHMEQLKALTVARKETPKGTAAEAEVFLAWRRQYDAARKYAARYGIPFNARMLRG